MRLSVVVPLFNEEDNVALLHREIREAALASVGAEHEIIYVDDGSTDGTGARLEALAEADPRVKVIGLRRNYGQTAALQAGFDHASGEVVVSMDGDLQNDPADIPRLLAKIDRGFDLVCGWRRERQDGLLLRRLPSLAANWLIRKVIGADLHDTGCTLKAYRLDLVRRSQIYAEMHRFLAPMMTLSGCRYCEIVVHHRPRRFGKSKYGMSRIWKVFLDLVGIKMLLSFTTRPALWFGLLGLPFLALSLLGLGALASWYLVTGRSSGMVFPAVTVLAAVTFAYLIFVGMFAELVVSFGDFRETEVILSRVKGRRSRR